MDSHKPPTWMTDKFFVKLLSSCEGDKEIKVSNFTIDSIAKQNDTYASPIFRANIEYSSKRTKSGQCSLILKVPSLVKTSFNSEDISFDTEIGIYSTTLPEMHRLLKHSGEDIQLAPKALFYSMEPHPVIVLEDISKLSYDVPNAPFNLDDNLSVVWKLAKWHATSYYMSMDHQSLTTYNSGLFNKKYSESLNFMLDNLRYFTEEVKTWKGFSVYGEKLEALQGKFLKKGEHIFTAQSAANGYNVLNHGDFHFKNIMCRRGDNDKLNLLFLDFQLCVWATPAIDLFYMFYMMASGDVRDTYKNELIHFYHKEFVQTLNNIGFLQKPPSLHDLQVELLKHGFLEVIITICLLPFLYVDPDEDFIDSNNARKVIYANMDYQNVMKKLLPRFLTKGFLD